MEVERCKSCWEWFPKSQMDTVLLNFGTQKYIYGNPIDLKGRKTAKQLEYEKSVNNTITETKKTTGKFYFTMHMELMCLECIARIEMRGY